MRYFIDISYLGTNYHGWQIQNNVVTIQQKINESLTTILGCETQCIGSGRTDTGVHAIHQVAHFDCENSFIIPQLKHKLNRILPIDISVNFIYKINESSSARFDAISRSYIYKIHQNKNPFLINFSYYFSRLLDLEKMNKACDLFQKHTNFESFSKVKTKVNNFDCKIFEMSFKLEKDIILFYVRANRFLRGMVRAIVGTMLDIGENKLELEDLEYILLSRDRNKVRKFVPAHGLYLNEIIYPKEILL